MIEFLRRYSMRPRKSISTVSDDDDEFSSRRNNVVPWNEVASDDPVTCDKIQQHVFCGRIDLHDLRMSCRTHIW